MALAKHTVFDADALDRSMEECDNPLPLFRDALRHGREVIRNYHQQHNHPAEIVSTHAWLVDQLLTRAWRRGLSMLASPSRLALVAVGGYGRGELHPCSDIDIMVLLDSGAEKETRGFIETLVQFLWDMGLEIGHSVRSVKDCIREAKADITVVTNLMEARLIDGDAVLFSQMRKATGPGRIWPSRKFFTAKWEEQLRRHHQFDDTAYNLEPNVKEGPGGLRDIQMILWVANRHFGANSLRELVDHEFLNEDEYRALIRGRNYLWHLRNGLHYLAGRREDRLLFDHQRALALQAGYHDKPGNLAVEQFMKRYYRTIKELSLLNEILLQHFQEEILSRGKPRKRVINRRFQACGAFIEVRNEKIFERSPYAMLEVFLLLEQNPRLKGVRAQTIRLLRANLHRIDSKFRKDIACRSLFMEILRQPRGITHELRRMNAYGVLGAYLPVFGRIVGQMQHDLFHVYTVDEHELFVLRNIRRFTIPEHRYEFPLASAIMEKIAKPERLYIAALFHDIAKGRSGDHSELGEKEARVFCEQHDLSEYDTRFIAWLVRNHLIMSWTSQKEDIDDPDVVLRFARAVGDQEHLDYLYVLTVADIRGTSPKVWNAWKGKLLSQLYAVTTRALRRGFGKPIDLEGYIANVQGETVNLVKSSRVSEKHMRRFWSQMDNDYFMRHNAESLAWHARAVVTAHVIDLPLVQTRYVPDIGASEFMVYTMDRPELFAILTGAFDRLNLSIVDARIHTSRNGYVLDTFIVMDAAGRPIADGQELKQLGARMRELMIQPQKGREPASAHLPRQLKHFPIEAQVNFSPSASGQQTILEVTAQDRPGLLYQIALALQECRVTLAGAKVATFGERAEDIFFITNRDGEPVTDPAQLEKLKKAILTRLAAGQDAGAEDRPKQFIEI